MKIVHFADVHLGMENYGRINPETGLHSRLGDFLNAFDQIVDYVLKNNIDLVIFPGDAYKTREPAPTYQREFAKRLYRIAVAGIPIVLVVGNHDFPNASGKADTLAIFPTLGVPNIYTFQSPELKIIETKSGPVQIAGLPWLSRTQLLTKDEMARGNSAQIMLKATKNLASQIELLSARVDDKIPSILAAHASVEGALFGSERQIMIGSEIAIPASILAHTRFNYVALGHLHKFQQVLAKPLTIYSGSIERVDFGEESDPKGFVVIQIEPKKSGGYLTSFEYKKIKTRPFITIRITLKESDTDVMTKIQGEISRRDVTDAIVRVIIQTPEAHAAEIRDAGIVERLKKAYFIASINREIQKGERLQTKEGFSEEWQSLEPLGVLEKYLESKKVSKERILKLKKETQRILEEAE